MSVDGQGVVVAGDHVSPSTPDGSRKLKEAVSKMSLGSKPPILAALRNAKTPDVAMVVDLLGQAGAAEVVLRTPDRNKRDVTLKVVPEKKAGKLADCTVAAMVLKDRSTASWPIRGGVATRYAKGMAGPDMTLTLEGITKQVSGCTSTVMVFSGDETVEWGLAFDVATNVANAQPPLKTVTWVLPRETPVAGRAVKIGELPAASARKAARNRLGSRHGPRWSGEDERMSKRGRKNKNARTNSQRPLAPSLDLSPKSVRSAVDEQPSILPPAAPDTFAPTVAIGEDTSSAEAMLADVRATMGPSGVLAATSSPRISAPRIPAKGLPVHDDETDLAFFEGETAAVEKLHTEARASLALEEEQVRRVTVRPLSPEVIARRNQLRRAVTWVVGIAGVMTALVVAKLALGRKEQPFDPAMVRAVAGDGRAVAPPVVTAAAVDTAQKQAPTNTHDAPVTAAAEPEKKAAAPVEPEKKVEAPAAAEAPAPAAPAGEDSAATAPAKPDPEKAKPLTRKALVSLESGKYAAAIEAASASLEADPTDANPYLYWGTALMEQGKRAEAKAVFAKCVELATRGPRSECRAFKLPRLAEVRVSPRLAEVRVSPRLAEVRVLPRLAEVRVLPRLAEVRVLPRLAEVRVSPRLAEEGHSAAKRPISRS